ncbi:MAG: FAD-dependent oxidoreductase [Desulfobulbaceae bacterium]|nr:FAD-dependent oxidoreductase [Desulfobulbaceae bacterium]
MSEKKISLWMHEKEGPEYPVLTKRFKADVAVVGAGITGLTTGLLLKEAGMKVAVIEAGRICSGTTGHTTAKVTALHNLIYSRLESTFGERTAGIFAAANSEAIAQVDSLVRQFGIDCSLNRLPAYTFTRDPNKVSELEKEVAAAGKAGLAARLVKETDLPFPVEAAVRLDDQAQIHPVKYCTALAAQIEGGGSRIFEQSRVVEVTEKGVRTGYGVVAADKIVLATLLPFLDRGAFFVSNFPWRSYLLAARLDGSMPAGMYISAEEPVRSISRTADGTMLLIGGESHKSGQDPDTRRRYEVLENWAREHFPIRSIEFSWSSQDFMPADGLPYIGPLHPFTSRIYAATGFGKWGMTRGTFGAMLIRDLILGRENPWQETFRTSRVSFIRSPGKLIFENMNVGRRFVQDRMGAYMTKKEEPPGAGEGRITRQGNKTAAVFREADGGLQVLSPVCTHLGCYVAWNTAEQSWDCPCHGSRFDVDGSILHGPALKKLDKKDDGPQEKE